MTILFSHLLLNRIPYKKKLEMLHIFEFIFIYIKLAIAFNWHQIIPDVITSTPRTLISVEWPGVNASLGNIATPTQVNYLPNL